LLAAVGGAGLILIQLLVPEVMCPLCLAVDGAAILVAAALLGRKAPWRFAEPPWPRRWVWLTTTLLAVGAPPAWAWLRPAPQLPQELLALRVPGKINVVEITDFECPACRQMHPVLDQVVRAYGDRVHLVRMPIALPGHDRGRAAARAYACAFEQGKGAEMATALFAAKDLSSDDCERLAAGLGVSLPQYRACVVSPAPDGQIDANREWMKRVGLRGVPAVVVQDEVILGYRPPDVLRAAFQRAEKSLAEPGN
jgi:predicted DsbA family dithiol-disulfide isomerase